MKINFKTAALDQYHMVIVAFDKPQYLRHFLVNIQSFCAYYTGNFLNSPKLLLLPHFLLGTFKRKSQGFLGTPFMVHQYYGHEVIVQ